MCRLVGYCTIISNVLLCRWRKAYYNIWIQLINFKQVFNARLLNSIKNVHILYLALMPTYWIVLAGDYCEWQLTRVAVHAAENGNVYQCFEEFRNDLILNCDNTPTTYTKFIWTPTASTPDLLYYQVSLQNIKCLLWFIYSSHN